MLCIHGGISFYYGTILVNRIERTSAMNNTATWVTLMIDRTIIWNTTYSVVINICSYKHLITTDNNYYIPVLIFMNTTNLTANLLQFYSIIYLTVSMCMCSNGSALIISPKSHWMEESHWRLADDILNDIIKDWINSNIRILWLYLQLIKKHKKREVTT